MPGTVFSETEKVELTFEIQKNGFEEFEIGYAGVIPEHYQLIKRLINEEFSGKIYGRSEEWKKEEIPERIANCIRYAKNQSAIVTFGLADLIRTSFEKIVSCYQTAIEAGADRLYIYDEIGAARPEAIRFLTRFIKRYCG